MIYNRAARFIFRDPANWQATLSPDLYWGFHADYPLLVSTNVTWAWASLGAENIRVPLVQSGLFLFACIGLLFTALAQVKGIGQAGLAAIILMSISGFVRSGSGQTADVPLMFYMLASISSLYLWSVGACSHNSDGKPSHPKSSRSKGLLLISGFMAGLAGWTKNEGLLFIAVSIVILFFVFAQDKILAIIHLFWTWACLSCAYHPLFQIHHPGGRFVPKLSRRYTHTNYRSHSIFAHPEITRKRIPVIWGMACAVTSFHRSALLYFRFQTGSRNKTTFPRFIHHARITIAWLSCHLSHHPARPLVATRHRL